MRVVVLYRPNSEHATSVETFLHDYQRLYPPAKLDVINADTREGVAVASLYDVMSLPAILVLANDGVLQKGWQGGSLPMMDQLAAYNTAGALV